jgi:hypothetical protein
MLCYLPWKGLIMKMMTKGVAEAATAITIPDYASPSVNAPATMVQNALTSPFQRKSRIVPLSGRTLTPATARPGRDGTS